MPLREELFDEFYNFADVLRLYFSGEVSQMVHDDIYTPKDDFLFQTFSLGLM